MIRKELLEILVCPETHQPLRELSADELAVLNDKIQRGGIKNRSGRQVTEPLDGALLRQDERVAYPVVDNLPVMLVDEAISY